MASLLQPIRRGGIALAVAVGLTILAAVATPLLGNELADVLPGVTDALADESQGSGG